MLDRELVAQPDDPYVVVLQDGRQLDGTLRRFEHHLEVAGTVFEPWEADDVLLDRASTGLA